MIGQTIVNVELGRARSRVSTVAAGLVLLLLVTGLSRIMAQIPMVVLAGIMMVVAVKTVNWHSLQPATLKRMPWSETLIMVLTVAVTVWTGNLALGVLAGVIAGYAAVCPPYCARYSCGASAERRWRVGALCGARPAVFRQQQQSV